MSSVVTIPNRQFRRLFLESQGIRKAQPGFDKQRLLALIETLGYVQVDSITAIERAHHLTLFSRESHYRPEMLRELVEQDRLLFEHWTHDACIVPVSLFPHWRHRFETERAARTSGRWKRRLGKDPDALLDAVRARIRREGPLRSRDFERDRSAGRSSWWGWSQEKSALEYLWRSGELGITRRDGFEKVYDRIERVVPAPARKPRVSRAASVAWMCDEALARLVAATPKEIAAFWDAFPLAEARAWTDAERRRGRLISVAIETADGSAPRPRVARPEIVERAREAPAAPRGMRLLCPFDPLIRDRTRTSWLFGFDYRIEVFVPAAKRRYGYYVLPILEGERLTGRVDSRAKREEGVLEVQGLWWEAGIAESANRRAALQRCLQALARFVGAPAVRRLERPRA